MKSEINVDVVETQGEISREKANQIRELVESFFRGNPDRLKQFEEWQAERKDRKSEKCCS